MMRVCQNLRAGRSSSVKNKADVECVRGLVDRWTEPPMATPCGSLYEFSVCTDGDYACRDVGRLYSEYR